MKRYIPDSLFFVLKTSSRHGFMKDGHQVNNLDLYILITEYEGLSCYFIGGSRKKGYRLSSTLVTSSLN